MERLDAVQRVHVSGYLNTKISRIEKVAENETAN